MAMSGISDIGMLGAPIRVSGCDLRLLCAASRTKSVFHNGRNARVRSPSSMAPLERYAPKSVANVALILPGMPSCSMATRRLAALLRISRQRAPGGEHRGSRLMLKKSPGFLKGTGLEFDKR